jgi:glycosyltransferase involved in cell wall biosynthesis
VTSIRILHVISTMAPTSGGPTRVLRDLPMAQVSAGHQVTVCTTDRSNPSYEKLPVSYFQALYPGQQVDLKVFPVIFSPLLIAPRMARWFGHAIRTFDIVHIHGLYRFPPTYAATIARRAGVPYVISPRGSLDPFLYGKSSRSVLLKRLYERWFDLPNLYAAGAIHFTAEEERERASFLRLRAPSFVVPNGLDWENFRTLPPRGPLRSRWGLGDAPLILFLGRVHFKKGLDLLIPAFDTVRKTHPDAQLVIAGPENDDYGKQVRGWVRERGLTSCVKFVGPLYGVDVIQAYVDADIFVLPSYTENFGNTVIEAAACGRPVVISDQVNIHAEVAAAGAGLVTRCDANELARALQTLLDNPECRQAMGEAGRRMVQQRYTWSAIVPRLTREYEAVIRRVRRTQRQEVRFS